MVQKNGTVIWVGRVKSAAYAVPCPTCNAELGKPCEDRVFPLPHANRARMAEVYGFRDVARPGPLFA